MASIAWSVCRIKNRLTELLSPALIGEACAAAGHRWRRGVLGPFETVHLMILQLLHGLSLAGVRHAAGGMRFTASALCQAQARLPLAVLRRLVTEIAGVGGGKAAGLWRGLRAAIVDGSGFLLSDTPELRKKFGKPNGQKDGCGLPVLKLAALVDRQSGLLRRAIALPLARQEMSVIRRLIRFVGCGGLLLGDRAFASFAHFALLRRGLMHACVRLPRHLLVRGRGRGRLRWRKKLGGGDCLVSWARPAKRVPWLSLITWRGLPAELELRQVSFRVRRKGYRTRRVSLVTTLLDPGKYPACELAELYATRWRVELCFRDIKKTLGVEGFSARSVQGVLKQVQALVLVYNLIRLVMLDAAARQKTQVWRLSFADALAWVRHAPPGQGPPRLLVNPRRELRVEPRAVKRVKNDFPRMSRPREELRKALPSRALRRIA